MSQSRAQRIEADILIVGGGLAGLSAALRLAADGHKILCIDPAPFPTIAGRDPRTTAILMPGIETLTQAGVWQALCDDAQPLKGMRMVDCGGRKQMAREGAHFEASEAGKDAFGFNVENEKARLVLANAAEASPQIELMTGAALKSLLARDDAVFATLQDGRSIRAKLVVGADGRGSKVRELAGIGLRRWGYPQKIIAARVEHTRPHRDTSIEMHHVGGPLTFAPLPGNCSGLVWMRSDAEADRLAALDDAAFLADLNAASQGLMGEITALTCRALMPASAQIAAALTARRIALIAEAAHAFPPIGAQGFNLSLRDIETLALHLKDNSDPGETDLLARYSRARMPDILARTAGVDALNRSVLSQSQPVRDLRRAALTVLGGTPPLKRLAMRFGMGK